MKKILLLSLVLITLLGWARPDSVKKSCVALGTIVEITVGDKDKSGRTINAAIERAFAEIKRIEDLLSRFKSQSDISQINSFAQQRPLKVTPETIDLIEKSLEFSRLTKGAFDITIWPLVDAWKAKDKNREYRPEAKYLKQAKSLVGYQNIKLNKEGRSVFLAKPGMSLDLGGLAKGYAVDRAVQSLKADGIESALVNAGGDIYAFGERNETKSWRIALKHPRKKKANLTIMELQNKACATSGDYQQPNHIINPQTGEPCENVPASVTVISADCLSADALATSIFVLGPRRGLDLINRLEQAEAIIVSSHSDQLKLLFSEGLKEKVDLGRINP